MTEQSACLPLDVMNITETHSNTV